MDIIFKVLGFLWEVFLFIVASICKINLFICKEVIIPGMETILNLIEIKDSK